MIRKVLCIIFAALILFACVFKIILALFGAALLVVAWLI